MNKLDEIIETHSRLKSAMAMEDLKSLALEFAKHILEEAASNAQCCIQDSYIDKYIYTEQGEIKVYKQSITDTLNKYL